VVRETSALILITDEYIQLFQFTDKERAILTVENKMQEDLYLEANSKQYPQEWTKERLSTPAMRYGIYKGRRFNFERPELVFGVNEYKEDPNGRDFYGELNAVVTEIAREFQNKKDQVMECVITDRINQMKAESQDLEHLSELVESQTIKLSQKQKEFMDKLKKEVQVKRKKPILITDQEAENYGMDLTDRVTLMEQKWTTRVGRR
jgi:hypothetical protein